jgi:hypothetical protein
MIVMSRLADAHLWAEALNLGAYDVLVKKALDRTEVTRVLSLAWVTRDRVSHLMESQKRAAPIVAEPSHSGGIDVVMSPTSRCHHMPSATREIVHCLCYRKWRGPWQWLPGRRLDIQRGWLLRLGNLFQRAGQPAQTVFERLPDVAQALILLLPFQSERPCSHSQDKVFRGLYGIRRPSGSPGPRSCGRKRPLQT